MKESITQTKIWDAVTQTAFFDRLSRLYWNIRLSREGNRVSKEVDGTSATFTVTEREEYIRVRSVVSEEQVLKTLMDRIEPDDVVFDVGANIGMFACFAGRVLESGRVIGFEPEPTNRRRAIQNLLQNADDVEFSVYSGALFDSDGKTELQVAGGLGTGTHSLISHTGEDTVTVPTQRAETLIDDQGYPIPDVVKVDVEGAEFRVLDGFGRYLSEVGTVICEVHTEKIQEFGDSVSAVESRLEQAGFDVSVIMERGTDYHLLATEMANVTDRSEVDALSLTN